MSSLLKRKRGPTEVGDAPARTGSVKEQPIVPTYAHSNAGWDAAFNPKNKILPGRSRPEQKPNNLTSRKESEREPDWKLSEPIGGRMINAEPVFTADEKFLIVANRTTIHVYSTLNSLLTRSIKLQIDFVTRPTARIIAYRLSPTNSSLIWVACSDGVIYNIDWTTGIGAHESWTISSTGCTHMTMASMESAGRRRDVVFTIEAKKDGGWRITANELAPPNGPIKTEAKTIYTTNQRINFLTTAQEGAVIVAAAGKTVLLGSLRNTKYGSIDKIKYEFRLFDSTDYISSLDIRVYNKISSEEPSKPSRKKPVIDVVVGGVKGSVFVHNDLLTNLSLSQSGDLQTGVALIPRKLHWHRQSVNTVKWSLDGNYIISGGTETVLVLWQLDTGKKQFLPHMSATIQNLVISPSGSSYGVQLGDNSTMVLSTAELKPTANIAGVQACVLGYEDTAESHVWRVEADPIDYPLVQRTPVAINPTDPSRLLLGVGQNQEINPSKPVAMNVPYLQTFDLASGHNISRQALTRSNVTNINIAPNAHPVSEPRVTLMQMSHDGKWLATVDEWIPPKSDVEFIGHRGSDLAGERRRRKEVFLKFWQLDKATSTWELVSRIDSPHTPGDSSCGAGRILGLAADPTTKRFSTIGEDGIIRTWTTKTRKRDGVVVKGKGGSILRNWTCEHAISLGKYHLRDEATLPRNGCVAFSEDGSILAAAVGRGNHGLVHFLDPKSGIVRVSHIGLFEGEIIKMEFLGQDLITLSNRIQVFDLVSEETRYGIALEFATIGSIVEQKIEMMHLAVDKKSRTFAVALPGRDNATVKDLKTESLLDSYSELAIFHQDQRTPFLTKTFRTIITALLPTVDTEGYLVLDTAAEIRTITKKGTDAITSLAQPTSALRLDPLPDEATGDLLRLVEDEEMEEAEDIQPATPDINEEANEIPVVTQQQLSQIFDIGPAFALPPMEEMFYQVAGLFSSKPLVKSVI
ncbi:hypothetical protein B7494_g5298 [Chlorociboria aeruginascens]|nr:hypothetical protein B7494_g5298 [Chlorociboria aeruginascens]